MRLKLLSQPAQSPARGFTLIELLVVVAIIALLLGILLPSMAAARKSARASICASNIRHLALSNIAYATEHRDHFVPAAEDFSFHGNFNVPINMKRWHGQRDDFNEPFDPARGPLVEFLGRDGQVKQCPSFIDYLDTAGVDAGFEAGAGGYGYNQQYIGGRYDLAQTGGIEPDNTTATTTAVMRPQQTVMFTDAAFLQHVNGEPQFIAYSFSEPPRWASGPGTPNPTIHFRHRGQANVAWVDGHVGARDIDFSVSYQPHSRVTADEAAAIGVGWFGLDHNELFDLE